MNITVPGRVQKDGNGVERHMRAYRPALKLPPSHRRLMVAPPSALAALPDAIYPAQIGLVPTYDQGGIGSCTANAVAYDMTNVMIIALAMKGLKVQDVFRPSRMFIYKKTRQIEGTPLDEDSGATIADTNQALETYGAPTEELDPYVDDGIAFALPPTDEETRDALKHQALLSYEPISIADQKHCMAQGFGVQCGFTCFESLMTRQCAETGLVLPPEPGERTVGGHAIYKVGYDNNMKVGSAIGAWLCLWSWGEWGAEIDGMKRYGWLPFSYDRDGLAGDNRTIRLVEMP